MAVVGPAHQADIVDGRSAAVAERASMVELEPASGLTALSPLVDVSTPAAVSLPDGTSNCSGNVA